MNYKTKGIRSAGPGDGPEGAVKDMIKKYVSLAVVIMFLLAFTACGRKETGNPISPGGTVLEEWQDSADQNPNAMTFQAIVLEIQDEMLLTEPVEGSAERLSADKIYVVSKDGLELEAGDRIEITYDGSIMETYPAQLGQIYSIELVEKAKTETKWDKIPAVMVDGKLYFNTGRESAAEVRCGMMDGEITSSVDGSKWPARDGESNFGAGYGYQYGENNTIEIYINEKWMVFEQHHAEKEEHGDTKADAENMDEICRIVWGAAKKEEASCDWETAASIVAELGEKGFVAVDSNNQVDMAGAKQVLKFCEMADRGETGELTIIVVDGSDTFITYDLECESSGITVTRACHKPDENGNFQTEGGASYPASFWQYTEEGYLMFEGSCFSEEEFVLTLSNTPEHTAFRVLPLDEECREYNRSYILPVGYGWNNLFLCDWSEKDYGSLDFYDLFDIFYPHLYDRPVPYIASENGGTEGICLIPKDIFESVIMTYFRIDAKTLRSKTTYLPEKEAYEYRPRSVCETQYPDIPYPEVVSYRKNQDGTLTLMINGVYPYENTSKSFSHKTVIRLTEDGHAQYISNEMIWPEEQPDTWWHYDRLSEEEWKAQIPKKELMDQ